MVNDIFAKRLTELRESKNISQQELAEVLGITRQSISLYEKAERNINIELLTKIAKYFNVSADYLLGISDVSSSDIDDKAICENLGIKEETLLSLKELNELSCNIEADFGEVFGLKDNFSLQSMFEILISSIVDNERAQPSNGLLAKLKKYIQSKLEIRKMQKQYDDVLCLDVTSKNKEEYDNEIRNIKKLISQEQDNCDAYAYGIHKNLMSILETSEIVWEDLYMPVKKISMSEVAKKLVDIFWREENND